ncbi:MAG: asparagine synthase (glutamine-hydrolyzing) [Chitinophagaceae bacterium]|nr:MAG: asparagine synthase (glutamine-hydrolyzing) [Chitinophagaceae bacterium]
MCGLAGVVDLEQKLNLSTEDWKSISACIKHRGPDADGLYTENGFSLLHRRLSILDLSEQGNQPMHSQCNRYVIAYNGEIYNFNEILSELKEERPQFAPKTTTDTEIILEAFACWGKEFISKCNGMFVFAIWDKQKQTLFLFRDRLGIKPLYFYHQDGLLVFASELKAIKKILGEKCGNISREAVNAFLHLGYIPEPLSIYSKVQKFPSGEMAEYKNKKLDFVSYWKPEERVTEEILTDESEAKTKLHELLESSVKYRLISDVPFGTFLSGGIDSSVVTAVASKLTSKPLNTFSIGFKEQSHNEAEYAAKVAKHLGTRHHEFIVSQKDVQQLVPDIIDVYDEPFSDSSAFPTMLVSKLAREHVTMTLSGDGGDELFMGYGAYKWAGRLQNPILKLLRLPIRQILSRGNNRQKRAAHMFYFPDEKHMPSHIFAQEQYLFRREEIEDILLPDFQSDFQLKENFTETSRKLTTEENQALFDLKNYLKDDLLVKVDRASMRYSLETRVPLLDYRIVEFAINLSPELKIKNKSSKYLLKQVLYNYVPEELFKRPKWGFSIPLIHWLKDELRFLIDDYLNEKVITSAGFVKYNKVDVLKKRFLSGEDYLYNRLWLLIVLHKWWKEAYNSTDFQKI